MKLNKLFGRHLFAAIQLFSTLASAQTREHQFRDVPVQPPLVFEINRGQTDQRVKFLSRGNGYTLFLTPAEAMLSLRPQSNRTRRASKTAVDRRLKLLRISLVGAKASPEVIGLDELLGKSNYFIGSDPQKWQTNIPVFTRVKYQSVYPGIDLIYYGNQGQLEHDFVVAPRADPRKITLSIRGAKVHVDSQGDLRLSIDGGMICLHRPRVYQNVGKDKKLVVARYVAKGSHRFGFDITEYDMNRPLIIDPVLSYSTYLGGALGDFGYSIAVDSAGSAYVTGATGSANFPTTAGAIQASLGGTGSDDAFVTKLSATGGALVYSTYLGGSGEDVGVGIAVDAAGSAYVTGQTASNNFPTRNPLQPGLIGTSDVFVAKLSPDGSALLYSTYLGGSGDDVGNGIAVDSAGNAYVTGATESTNFPTTQGAWQTIGAPSASCGTPPNTFLCDDGFVTKLNTAGSALVYSTYLAGNRDDSGNGIVLDSSGNAYVAGFSDSADFHTTPNAFQTGSGGGYDAFVVKLNAQGTGAVYSTYLGGSADDDAAAIAIDSSGSAYVTGSVRSANFPTKNPFQAALVQGSAPVVDAYVAKFDPAGGLAYSTYLGGSSRDLGFAIAVDSLGNAYVTGRTDSPDFPTERPVLQAVGGGPGHAFVTELNASGNALVYSTYLGGSGGRDRGFGIALDSSRKVYVTGFTNSTTYPTTNGAFRTTNQGMDDAFVTKIDDSAPDFTVAVAGSNSANVSCGQTANYNLQIVPFNGFTGSVGVNCTLAPQGMGSVQGLTCRPSADSVNVTGGSAPFGISVVSTGRSLLAPTAGFGKSDDERKRAGVVGIVVLLMFSILVGVFKLRARHAIARLSAAGTLVVFLLLVAQLGGCGKGGNHAQPGMYTVTVTGMNQTVARTVILALTVDCPR